MSKLHAILARNAHTPSYQAAMEQSKKAYHWVVKKPVQRGIRADGFFDPHGFVVLRVPFYKALSNLSGTKTRDGVQSVSQLRMHVRVMCA